MPWFRKPDGSMSSEENKLEDIEFKPEEFKKELSKDFGEKLTALQTEQDKKMQPLLDMATQLAADRAEKAETLRIANEKKNKENSEVTSEDFLLDPVEAARRLNQPVAQATMMLAARMAVKDTLENKDFYHGEFKTKVDKYVASMSLEQQMNPASIENCYKIVLGESYQDINEGKIKARTSSSQFESSGTGGSKGSGEESTETLTKEEEHMAKQFGMTPKQWADSKKEMVYV